MSSPGVGYPRGICDSSACPVQKTASRSPGSVKKAEWKKLTPERAVKLAAAASFSTGLTGVLNNSLKEKEGVEAVDCVVWRLRGGGERGGLRGKNLGSSDLRFDFGRSSPVRGHSGSREGV